MKTLYNEGRVVGLSAYELYVRQLLSKNSSATPLTESQWLAASISTNNSMILKIAANTTAGYHDYTLPSGSDLCSCTYIIASLFEGSCQFNGVWAKRVDDYGRLISNTGDRYPVTPGASANVPAKLDLTPSDVLKAQCKEYMKITSGIMLQPGTWIDNIYQTELQNESGVNITTEDDEDLLADLSDSATRKTLQADMSKRGFIRLLFDAKVTNEFYVFLHGFSYKNIMSGVTGFDSLLTTSSPQNGDFLGPQSFPWAVPISIMCTNLVIKTLLEDS